MDEDFEAELYREDAEPSYPPEPDLVETLEVVFGKENVFVVNEFVDEADREEPSGFWLCPICGKRIFIDGTTTDGRLIGSCNDAFTLPTFLQETRDFLINMKGYFLEDHQSPSVTDHEDADWAHLSRAFVEIGMDPLQPIEQALSMVGK